MSRVARLTVGCARAIATSARADVAATSSRAGVIGLASQYLRGSDCTARSASGMQLGWLPRSVSTTADHTSKWMMKKVKKTPMEFINEVPPIEVPGRIAACEGGKDPALGHPVEYINLDSPEPAVCKYCGLRYVQKDHH